jgi:hypothetical protein
MKITTITDNRGIHIYVGGSYHCTVANETEQEMIFSQIESGQRAA